MRNAQWTPVPLGDSPHQHIHMRMYTNTKSGLVDESGTQLAPRQMPPPPNANPYCTNADAPYMAQAQNCPPRCTDEAYSLSVRPSSEWGWCLTASKGNSRHDCAVCAAPLCDHGEPERPRGNAATSRCV